jgi:hypothetical protein
MFSVVSFTAKGITPAGMLHDELRRLQQQQI